MLSNSRFFTGLLLVVFTISSLFSITASAQSKIKKQRKTVDIVAIKPNGNRVLELQGKQIEISKTILDEAQTAYDSLSEQTKTKLDEEVAKSSFAQAVVGAGFIGVIAQYVGIGVWNVAQFCGFNPGACVAIANGIISGARAYQNRDNIKKQICAKVRC